MTDVRQAFADDQLATLQIDPALPVVAFRIPNVSELSRKEREDNWPMFDKNKGAKFIVAPSQGIPTQTADAGKQSGGKVAQFIVALSHSITGASPHKSSKL